MRFHRQLPVFAAFGGLAGAFLRAMQLATGFESGTGLYSSGNLWGRLLAGWLLLTAALCAVLARRGQHHACFEELFGSDSDVFKTVLAFSGLLLALGGVAWLAVELQTMQTLPEDSTSWILALEVPFGVLCVTAGLCFVGLGAALSRGEITARHALLTMPPLFWAAFHLLVVYRQYCVSANLPLFTNEIFASIACVMAFYHYARMLYGHPAPRQFAFWAALTVALSLTDVFGYVLSLAVGNLVVRWTLGSIVRGGCLLMGNAFLFAELWTIAGRKLFPWRTKYSPELEDEEPGKPEGSDKPKGMLAGIRKAKAGAKSGEAETGGAAEETAEYNAAETAEADASDDAAWEADESGWADDPEGYAGI